MIAGLRPVTRTVTPVRMRNERNSKTTAVEPSVVLKHVLRMLPVEMKASEAGSKSSGLPSFDTVRKPVQPGGPCELFGPDGVTVVAMGGGGPLSPSPATSRKPWTLLCARAVLTSAIVRFVSIGTSPLNSKIFVLYWIGRSSVEKDETNGTRGLWPKSWMPLLHCTTISASSGNSPNVGVSVSCVASTSCVRTNVVLMRRGGESAEPLPQVNGSLGVWSVSGKNGPCAYW